MSDEGKMRERLRRFEVIESSYPDTAWFIDDDDFHWDGLITAQGDFENDAEKKRYLEAVAKVLSDHEDEIPFRPISDAGTAP